LVSSLRSNLDALQAHLQDKLAKELAMGEKTAQCITSRQPSNAGGFRRQAFTKPTNGGGKEKKQHVNPALRLPAGRWVQVVKKPQPICGTSPQKRCGIIGNMKIKELKEYFKT
jgi:hypothetical protein